MKQILAGLILMIHMSAIAQNTSYTVSKDAVEGGKIFNGQITFIDLENEASFTWLKDGREEYKPNKIEVEYLANHLKDYTMVVFLGTWCDDSHYLVPKLEKVLDLISYPQSQLTMYGVDREKATVSGMQKKYEVKLVPTVILIRDGKEAGRITESAHTSVEEELATIIKKDRQ